LEEIIYLGMAVPAPSEWAATVPALSSQHLLVVACQDREGSSREKNLALRELKMITNIKIDQTMLNKEVSKGSSLNLRI
jgi:hypothetical protein